MQKDLMGLPYSHAQRLTEAKPPPVLKEHRPWSLPFFTLPPSLSSLSSSLLPTSCPGDSVLKVQGGSWVSKGNG